MSENKIKEFIIAIDEYFDELKNKYKKQRDDILDVLNENVFVTGYENLFDEGMRSYYRGRYKRAIYYFERANKAVRGNFICIYNLGLSYQADNEIDKAIEHYLEALSLKNNDNDTIYNLGLCYLSKHEGELAEKYLKMALDNSPQDSNTKMNYILAKIECGDIDDAIKMAINLVKSNKTYIDFTLTVAKCIEEQSFGERDVENISKVIKLLNSYMKVCPYSSGAQLEISICYGKIGNWDLAMKHSLKALELDGKSYEINKQAGLVYYCSQNYEEALKYYEKALFINPIKNFEMNYNIALTYEKMGKLSDMERKAKYILKHFKKHPQIRSVEELLKKNNNQHVGESGTDLEEEQDIVNASEKSAKK